MIRVTFDPSYIDDLQDYYDRNECIREQQYLSQEKLLHLAVFCVTNAANHIDGSGALRKAPNVEAALDVVRQLSLLCENADQVDARHEPVIIVNGETNDERHNHERHITGFVTPTLIERWFAHARRLRAAMRSAVRGLIGRLNICSKTRPV